MSQFAISGPYTALVEPRRSLLFTVKTRMSRVRMSTPSRSAVGAAVQFRCVFYSAAWCWKCTLRFHAKYTHLLD